MWFTGSLHSQHRTIGMLRAEIEDFPVNHKLRLLLVEDEPAIRAGLIDVFIYHGFAVDDAVDGHEGLTKALRGPYALIILDVMLPGIDGFEICNRIRAQDRDQPIIMLTAKSNDEDIIRGLSLGADDYVAKPFSVAQLVLRVNAVLRRSRVAVHDDERIRLGTSITIDVRNLEGQRDTETVIFTRREMAVLQYLHAHRERAVPREELLHKVWGYARGADLETRTVDIHIAKLRRKLETEPAEPRHLITVRGAGYRLLCE